MSKENLEPGDIVASSSDLGIVMRNDEDSGLLIAYPGMDELTIGRPDELRFVGTIKELARRENNP